MDPNSAKPSENMPEANFSGNPKPATAPAQQRVTVLKTLNIAIEFGFIIVLPLLAFGYLGKYLDERYGQKFFILIGVLLALVSSGLWFYKAINGLLKDLRNQK